MEIQPLGERVLLEQVEKETRTAGGIYLPEESRPERKEGLVIAVGTNKDGKELPLSKGDRVIYGGYNNEELEMNGKKYVLIEFKDIMARIVKR